MRLYKPDIVCIDGAYLMSNNPAPEALGDWKELAAVSRDLKQTANTLETPIIGVVQANRGAAETDKVAGHNIAGSDAFSRPRHCFVCAASGSHHYWIGKISQNFHNKNRHGVMATSNIILDFQNMTLKEQV